jgi:hypothetical protein
LDQDYLIQEFMVVEDQVEDFVLLLQLDHQVVVEQAEEMDQPQEVQELLILVEVLEVVD